MTLPFSTQINGKPSFFVEKILNGILKNHPNLSAEIAKCEDEYMQVFGKMDDSLYTGSKIHTIREDKKDRWKVGNKIHFVINNRQKDRFQFAPILNVVFTQKIEMLYDERVKCFRVWIDGDLFASKSYGEKENINLTGLVNLALNDGFDNVDAFIMYFNKPFIGKIIHWTTYRYLPASEKEIVTVTFESDDKKHKVFVNLEFDFDNSDLEATFRFDPPIDQEKEKETCHAVASLFMKFIQSY